MGTDLRFLQWLERPTRAQDLVRLADLDPSNVTRALHRLEVRGLVTTRREGKDLVASRAGIAATMAARVFDAHPRLPWDELLTDAHIDILAFFSSPADDHLRGQLAAEIGDDRPRPYVPKTVDAAARWMGNSAAHAHRLVRDLADHVILVRTPHGYTLAPEHTLLREVAKLLAAERVVREIRRIGARAYPFWQLGPVALYQAQGTGTLDAPAGGMSLLPDYGFPVVEPTSTHLHASWKPGVSDAILQTYLQGPTRTLNVTLACLLYHTTRPNDFLERAQTYGVPVAARLIKSYAESPGGHTGGGFPSAEDYRDLAHQYGVTL
jgi:DNA-binding transcriptional ArsR family regulator